MRVCLSPVTQAGTDDKKQPALCHKKALTVCSWGGKSGAAVITCDERVHPLLVWSFRDSNYVLNRISNGAEYIDVNNI